MVQYSQEFAVVEPKSEISEAQEANLGSRVLRVSELDPPRLLLPFLALLDSTS